MRYKIMTAALMAAAVFAPVPAQAQSISDILSGIGSAASGIVEGIFTKTDLTVADIAGSWQGNGPAVCFKDDNFLKKAGGAAMAGVIEDKLAPYYKQFGLNDISVTIDKNGSFRMKVKLVTLSGTLSPNGNGTFNFKFTALGSMSIGNMTAYVQKSGKKLDIMFDATKMKSLLSTVAKFTNSRLATTVSDILDSYEGLCVGFKLTATADKGSSGKSSGDVGSILESLLGGDSGGSDPKVKSSGGKSESTTKKSDENPMDKLKNAIEKRKK